MQLHRDERLRPYGMASRPRNVQCLASGRSPVGSSRSRGANSSPRPRGKPSARIMHGIPIIPLARVEPISRTGNYSRLAADIHLALRCPTTPLKRSRSTGLARFLMSRSVTPLDVGCSHPRRCDPTTAPPEVAVDSGLPNEQMRLTPRRKRTPIQLEVSFTNSTSNHTGCFCGKGQEL